ncbi:GNAT family N-acetyltransferase [Pseudaquidulcibacter saccharophilus]|uniref:GNAT family N-acetyltransferase n=1 Tax=Pseudaquidulcibacter saccharophilus TaxID=2831900 RepID=UPI001EFF1485|nr:GNAT family N-acetyltransferase [Pseudaquidulcibacter saccharophilus]
MEIIVTEAKINSSPARELISELSAILKEISGDSGSDNFQDFDNRNPRNLFLLANYNSTPVGCVALREVDFETCELKRMYARHKGAGTRLLEEFEARALLLGFNRIILSTRRLNVKAIAFYKRNGFDEIEPYGVYKLRSPEISICMAKEI